MGYDIMFLFSRFLRGVTITMSKGKWKKSCQYEKLLVILLNAKGKEVSITEISTTLAGEIEWYRFSTYMWELKKMGAQIVKHKDGRRLVGITLVNTDEMLAYARSRNLVAPPPVELKPEDFMVAR